MLHSHLWSAPRSLVKRITETLMWNEISLCKRFQSLKKKTALHPSALPTLKKIKSQVGWHRVQGNTPKILSLIYTVLSRRCFFFNAFSLLCHLYKTYGGEARCQFHDPGWGRVCVKTSLNVHTKTAISAEMRAWFNAILMTQGICCRCTQQCGWQQKHSRLHNIPVFWKYTFRFVIISAHRLKCCEIVKLFVEGSCEWSISGQGWRPTF